jgi:hypothetical protein
MVYPARRVGKVGPSAAGAFIAIPIARLVEPERKARRDIVVVQLNRDGSVKSVDPFITGFIVDND